MGNTTATFVRFGNEIINLEAIVGINYIDGAYPALEITLTTGIWVVEPRNVAAAWEYFSSQAIDRALVPEQVEEESIDWGVVNAGLSKAINRGT